MDLCKYLRGFWSNFWISFPFSNRTYPYLDLCRYPYVDNYVDILCFTKQLGVFNNLYDGACDLLARCLLGVRLPDPRG